MAVEYDQIRGSPGWRATIFVLLSLLALSPTNTKVAGVLWFLTGLIAIWFGVRHRHAHRSDSPVAKAAQLWLLYMFSATLLWWISALIWNDPWAQGSADLHSAARLLMAALAGWTLLKLAPGRLLLPSPSSLITAAALSCLVAFVVSLQVTRDRYPSNAIPWAAAVTLLICILFPMALQGQTSPRIRLVALLGAALGLLALFENQTRGAYGVVLWLLTLWLSQWFDIRRRIALTSTAAMVILMLFSSTALLPNDPLRIRNAWQEAKASFMEDHFNTPVGARIYLYRLATESILRNPMTGIGPVDRLALIKNTGSTAPDSSAAAFTAITELGHVHNAYLHHLLDGGLIALSGFLLTIGGIVHAGYILMRFNPVAARQLWGIAFVHASTNLSSVNLAHNYYALMLSISLLLVFFTAQASAHSSSTRG